MSERNVSNDDKFLPSTANILQDNEYDLESDECCEKSCCNASSRSYRFLALIPLCFLSFGSYFCYDNPAALQDHLISDLNITNTEYSLFYSLYSWPNVIMCFFGGFLIDRVFGLRLGALIYQLIVLAGHILFATGVITNTFWLSSLGRFIFGIGAESLAVAQNKYAVVWFQGKELNMVFGLQLSISRVGSAVNSNVMEPIYQHLNSIYHDYRALGVTLFISTSLIIMSLIFTLTLAFMDKQAQKYHDRNEKSSKGEVVKLTDLTTFKITFWMVSIICVAYYAAIFPFIAIAKGLFIDRFGFTPDAANTLSSIIYYIAALASPLFGLAIDKIGRNVTWMLTSIVITTGCHVLLAFTSLTPYVAVTLFGLAYSMLASSLWPLVALIIPKYQLGTAYGICQAIQNLGLAIINILAGIIRDHSGYTILEVFFISWLIVAFASTIVIWYYDRKTHGNLNLSAKQRKATSKDA